MASDAPAETADEASDSAWLGRLVANRFRVVGTLGSGGIAHVFRGEDTEITRQVAIKVLKDEVEGHEELRGRFEREARALAALSHPNIVSLVDYGVTDGRAYLVMELLRGQTLRELLDLHGRLPPERAFAIVRQVLRALRYAHEQGLLHRDLKPDNVFLQELPDTADHVRLLDFGFAKFAAGDTRGGPALTRAGTVFGTPRYMAPEQLTGSSVDGRADLYSTAVILYECLAGRRPFEGEIRDVLKAKVVEDPPSLASVAPELAVRPELEALLTKALAMRRDERYPDAASFLDALEAIPQPAVRSLEAAAASAERRLEPQRKKSRAPWILGAIALVFAALGLGVLGYQLVGRDPPARAPVAQPTTRPVAPPPVAAAVDPWTNGDPVPPALAAIRARIANGEAADTDAMRELRNHQRDWPDDPRVHLLFGHVYTQRGMRAMALTSYQRAVELDRAARGDAQMLVNLVDMAARASAGGAERMIREVYGREALPAIDTALDTPALSHDEALRLQHLRESL